MRKTLQAAETRNLRSLQIVYRHKRLLLSNLSYPHYSSSPFLLVLTSGEAANGSLTIFFHNSSFSCSKTHVMPLSLVCLLHPFSHWSTSLRLVWATAALKNEDNFMSFLWLLFIYLGMIFANSVRQLMATQFETHRSLISPPTEWQPHQPFPIL